MGLEEEKMDSMNKSRHGICRNTCSRLREEKCDVVGGGRGGDFTAIPERKIMAVQDIKKQ